jgi:hypothetical protein
MNIIYGYEIDYKSNLFENILLLVWSSNKKEALVAFKRHSVIVGKWFFA